MKRYLAAGFDIGRSECVLSVVLLLDQQTRPIPFQGMRRLADALLRAVDACTTPTLEFAETSHA